VGELALRDRGGKKKPWGFKEGGPHSPGIRPKRSSSSGGRRGSADVVQDRFSTVSGNDVGKEGAREPIDGRSQRSPRPQGAPTSLPLASPVSQRFKRGNDVKATTRPPGRGKLSSAPFPETNPRNREKANHERVAALYRGKEVIKNPSRALMGSLPFCGGKEAS